MNEGRRLLAIKTILRQELVLYRPELWRLCDDSPSVRQKVKFAEVAYSPYCAQMGQYLICSNAKAFFFDPFEGQSSLCVLFHLRRYCGALIFFGRKTPQARVAASTMRRQAISTLKLASPAPVAINISADSSGVP